MLLVIAVELEHVLLAWCMWLGTVLAWAWSCIYMGDLSWMSIRAVKRWRGLHVIFGPAFLLGTIQLGIKIVPLGVLSMAAFAGLALWYGDYLSQFQRKVFGGPTAEGSDTSTVGILLARIKAWLRDSEGPVIGRAQNVLLFKKMGLSMAGIVLVENNRRPFLGRRSSSRRQSSTTQRTFTLNQRKVAKPRSATVSMEYSSLSASCRPIVAKP